MPGSRARRRQGGRAHFGEPGADLPAEPGDRLEVEVGRQLERLLRPQGRDVGVLTFEIGGVARLDLELLGHVGAQLAELRPDRRQSAPG